MSKTIASGVGLTKAWLAEQGLFALLRSPPGHLNLAFCQEGKW